MTGTLPASLLRPLTRRWPPAARLIAGAAVGWAISEWAVTTSEPSWESILSAALVAVFAVGAPMTARVDSLGGPPAWALASAVGLYVGVPETDHVVGVGAALVPFVVAELTGRARADGLVVLVLGATLTWAALEGAVLRDSALVAGLATVGLLAVWPLVHRVPGPARALLPPTVRPVAVAVLHGTYAVVVGRRGAVETGTVEVTLQAAAGLAVLLLLVRLAIGGRRP